MADTAKLPLPQLDALPLGAHRALQAITDERLFAQLGVRVAFTSRAGGVSEGPYASLNCGNHVGDDRKAVLRNRQIVLEALGAPDAPLVVPSQVHGTRVVQVESMSTVEEVKADAAEGADCVLVRPAGVAALLNFADCLPLIIVAPDGTFAVAHAGWRGAVAHMARLAAEALAKASGQDLSQFNAYIGPHIRSECFEVGPDVAQIFAEEFGQEVLAGERHVSLAAAVTCDLVRAGLDPDRVADACVCTKCHPDEYFSYRASGGTCGRNAAVAIRCAR